MKIFLAYLILPLDIWYMLPCHNSAYQKMISTLYQLIREFLPYLRDCNIPFLHNIYVAIYQFYNWISIEIYMWLLYLYLYSITYSYLSKFRHEFRFQIVELPILNSVGRVPSKRNAENLFDSLAIFVCQKLSNRFTWTETNFAGSSRNRLRIWLTGSEI